MFSFVRLWRLSDNMRFYCKKLRSTSTLTIGANFKLATSDGCVPCDNSSVWSYRTLSTFLKNDFHFCLENDACWLWNFVDLLLRPWHNSQRFPERQTSLFQRSDGMREERKICLNKREVGTQAGLKTSQNFKICNFTPKKGKYVVQNGKICRVFS